MECLVRNRGGSKKIKSEFVGISCKTLLCTQYRPAQRRLDKQIYASLFTPHVHTTAASGSVL